MRCLLDGVYVHFFVSRQRNGTKENALRGSAPKYPVGLCAFCPWGTKVISMVASLLFFLIVRIFENKGFVHNPASLAVCYYALSFGVGAPKERCSLFVSTSVVKNTAINFFQKF